MALASAMILSGVPTYAAQATTQTNQKQHMELKELTEAEKLSGLKEILTKQVANSKLTQAEADTIYSKGQAGDFSWFESNCKPQGNMQEMTTEQKLARLKEILTKQVSDGKLTQAEADAIYIKAQAGDFSWFESNCKPQENIENMTSEEKLPILKEALTRQVSNSKLTQTEADTIYTKAQAGDFSWFESNCKPQGHMAEMTTEQKLARLKEILAKQVSDGKLTQAEADAIYAKAEAGDFSWFETNMKPQNNQIKQETGKTAKTTKTTN